ncbi:hypothetical protein K438DRAFT_1968544 [Mycena galopus ATCC 62051]|nr:hypothetical protein K438DRAFT_1968544 [Mycena galopus ATCC 62051]
MTTNTLQAPRTVRDVLFFGCTLLRRRSGVTIFGSAWRRTVAVPRFRGPPAIRRWVRLYLVRVHVASGSCVLGGSSTAGIAQGEQSAPHPAISPQAPLPGYLFVCGQSAREHSHSVVALCCGLCRAALRRLDSLTARAAQKLPVHIADVLTTPQATRSDSHRTTMHPCEPVRGRRLGVRSVWLDNPNAETGPVTYDAPILFETPHAVNRALKAHSKATPVPHCFVSLPTIIPPHQRLPAASFRAESRPEFDLSHSSAPAVLNETQQIFTLLHDCSVKPIKIDDNETLNVNWFAGAASIPQLSSHINNTLAQARAQLGLSYCCTGQELGPTPTLAELNRTPGLPIRFNA